MIEVDFREQQGQVLEVLPDDRHFAASDPWFIEQQRMTDMFWSYSSSCSVGRSVKLKSCAVSA